MDSTTSKCGLFLHPTQADFSIDDDNALFISQLQNIGLIAKQLTQEENTFYTGKRYLDFIAYMGCSPAIQFEASDSCEDFCHIKIHFYNTKQLIVSPVQSRAPHCPRCNKPVKNWLDNKAEATITCTLCNNSSDLGEFDWRKMAGYARVFIEITDIFPKEAIPQQILLDELNKACKTEWSYFYSCN